VFGVHGNARVTVVANSAIADYTHNGKWEIRLSIRLTFL
jgi:hypothetical protein